MNKKRSKAIVLGLTLFLAQSCRQDNWIEGDRSKDTVVRGSTYRRYGGYYYPVIRGHISPNTYNGYTHSDFKSSSFSGYTKKSSWGSGSHSSSRRSGGFGTTFGSSRS
ncbi:hypothetical protein AD998_17945 [bacterium 336/3]|jgi:hypothetical protein|nr:hypothetical protein AD998_17945 [bacterium 336/3]